jgi:hypothetical protein
MGQSWFDIHAIDLNIANASHAVFHARGNPQSALRRHCPQSGGHLAGDEATNDEQELRVIVPVGCKLAIPSYEFNR